MQDTNIPQTWLKKVQYYLERDLKLKDRAMANPTPHPKGEKFGALIWQVTSAIQAKGDNPSAYSKQQIIEAAASFLASAGEITPAEAAASVTPAPKPAEVGEAVSEAFSNEGEEQMKLDLPVKLSIITLLCSAIELTRLDKATDSAELKAELDKIVRRYYKGLRR